MIESNGLVSLPTDTPDVQDTQGYPLRGPPLSRKTWLERKMRGKAPHRIDVGTIDMRMELPERRGSVREHSSRQRNDKQYKLMTISGASRESFRCRTRQQEELLETRGREGRRDLDEWRGTRGFWICDYRASTAYEARAERSSRDVKQ